MRGGGRGGGHETDHLRIQEADVATPEDFGHEGATTPQHACRNEQRCQYQLRLNIPAARPHGDPCLIVC